MTRENRLPLHVLHKFEHAPDLDFLFFTAVRGIDSSIHEDVIPNECFEGN